MAKLQFGRLAANNPIINVFITDLTSASGAGLTGLTSASSGLRLDVKRELEATPTTYTVAASNLETITTIGTYAAPTSGKARFKEIDSSALPGFYEIHLAQALLGTGDLSRFLVGSLRGAANMPTIPFEIQLDAINHQDAVRAGLTALPNAAAEAAGGLFTRGTGAGQVNQDGNGRIDTNLIRVNGLPTLADSGTLQAADATHATLAAGAPAVTLVDWILLIEAGTGKGQWRRISAYNTGTKQATVNTWTTTPDTTSKYIVIGF